MKYVGLIFLLSIGLNAQAEVSVESCVDNLAFNFIFDVHTYANGSIKVFDVDTEEPNSQPRAFAVIIDRGSYVEPESYCRFVPRFAHTEFKKMKSKYDTSSGILTLTVEVDTRDPEDGSTKAETLEIQIDKGAKEEADLVKAQLK